MNSLNPKKQKYNCITLIGPTASGKTSLAVRIAQRYTGEIVSADSRQVYCGLDIGSGKDLNEYGHIHYHLIDIVHLDTEYSVFAYQRDFYKIFKTLLAKPTVPIICGGTGMYVDSILRAYQFETVPKNKTLRKQLAKLSQAELTEKLLTLKEKLHNKTDLENRDRLIRAIEIADYQSKDSKPNPPPVRVNSLTLGIQFERQVLRERIDIRLTERTNSGLIEEVQGLYDSGVSWERLERLGLEYKITAEFLQGKIKNKATWQNTLYTEICRFAKRQETWFRGMERKGVKINWIPQGDETQAFSIIDTYFSPRLRF